MAVSVPPEWSKMHYTKYLCVPCSRSKWPPWWATPGSRWSRKMPSLPSCNTTEENKILTTVQLCFSLCGCEIEAWHLCLSALCTKNVSLNGYWNLYAQNPSIKAQFHSFILFTGTCRTTTNAGAKLCGCNNFHPKNNVGSLGFFQWRITWSFWHQPPTGQGVFHRVGAVFILKSTPCMWQLQLIDIWKTL